MDRLTPFTASEVIWSVTTQARDRARGRLILRLCLVPRICIAPALAALARLGLTPSWLSVAGPTPRSLPLSAIDPGRRLRREAGLAALRLLSVALAGLAIALPFVRQSIADATLDRRIVELKPALAELDALRTRAQALQSAVGGDVVAAERNQAGDKLTVLATLTDLLPDDTYLTEFAMAGRVITLRGQSAASAHLIEVLAGHPAIADPTFAAPVTRVEAGRAELFAIRAQWRAAP